jgi:serine/threonine-protein kinase RIO1
MRKSKSFIVHYFSSFENYHLAACVKVLLSLNSTRDLESSIKIFRIQYMSFKKRRKYARVTFVNHYITMTEKC